MQSDDEIRQIILQSADEDIELRDSACTVLRNTDDRRFLSIALDMLNSTDDYELNAAYNAIRLLEKIDAQEILEKILPLLDNPVHCAWAIRCAAGLDVAIVSSLTRFVVHPDEEVRYTAFWAIDGLGHPDRLDIALYLLNDKSAEMRAKACRVLSGQKNAIAVESLIAKLKDNEIGIADRPVSADAAAALGTIGDERAIDALQVAVRFGSEELACCSLRALHLIDVQASEDFFLEQINHRYECVRREVVQCLGSLGASHVDILISTLQIDPSYSVQLAIANSLGFIGTPEARTAAIHWNTHYRREEDAFP